MVQQEGLDGDPPCVDRAGLSLEPGSYRGERLGPRVACGSPVVDVPALVVGRAVGDREHLGGHVPSRGSGALCMLPENDQGKRATGGIADELDENDVVSRGAVGPRDLCNHRVGSAAIRTRIRSAAASVVPPEVLVWAPEVDRRDAGFIEVVHQGLYEKSPCDSEEIAATSDRLSCARVDRPG